jgi:putative transposase
VDAAKSGRGAALWESFIAIECEILSAAYDDLTNSPSNALEGSKQARLLLVGVEQGNPCEGFYRQFCHLTFRRRRTDVQCLVQVPWGHMLKQVIIFAVFIYVRYIVSYRDLEAIIAERGVRVDHATLNRWVARYSPQITANARRRKASVNRSWRMDETYIKEKGEWVYLYRAVDKLGKTTDFMLSKRRNKSAATRFFASAFEVNGLPRKIVIDKSGANTAGINAINRMLKCFGCPIPIEIIRIKYLNNMVGQDYRTIRKRIRPMRGFKSFASASATLDGIEVANMI